MTDNIETREASGGWEVPTRPDGDGLKEAFTEGHVTFRKNSGAFNVYLDGRENVDVWKCASRHGFAIADVTVIDGPFDVKLRIDGKQIARQTADSKENKHRVPDTNNTLYE